MFLRFETNYKVIEIGLGYGNLMQNTGFMNYEKRSLDRYRSIAKLAKLKSSKHFLIFLFDKF